jgi:hypothetical protein
MCLRCANRGLGLDYGIWLPRSPPSIEPGTAEESVHLFHAEASNLGHHQIDVDESDEAPAGEEDEGSPVVHLGEDVGHCGVYSVVEQPVEALRQRAAKGP